MQKRDLSYDSARKKANESTVALHGEARLIVDKVHNIRYGSVLVVVFIEDTRQPIPVDFGAIVEHVRRILIDLLIRYG